MQMLDIQNWRSQMSLTFIKYSSAALTAPTGHQRQCPKKNNLEISVPMKELDEGISGAKTTQYLNATLEFNWFIYLSLTQTAERADEEIEASEVFKTQFLAPTIQTEINDLRWPWLKSVAPADGNRMPFM